MGFMAISASASAEDASSSVPTEPKVVKRWYGYQTLLGVGVSDIVMLIGSQAMPSGAASNGVWALGAAGHVLTPPIVHWAHGHGMKGLASLGLTVGAPLVLGGTGFLIGISADSNRENDLPLYTFVGTVLGLSMGTIAATIIDVTVLAKEEEKRSPAPSARASTSPPASMAILPIFEKNRTGLALIGQF